MANTSRFSGGDLRLYENICIRVYHMLYVHTYASMAPEQNQGITCIYYRESVTPRIQYAPTSFIPTLDYPRDEIWQFLSLSGS